MRCIYCSRSQCARTRHYLMNVFLCNARETQDAATNNSVPDAKGLDEVAGTFVHSAKECPCIPAPFVGLGGRNIGTLSHRIFCVKRSRLELARLAKDRLALEINPHLEGVRRTALRIVRNGIDLKPCIKANKDVLARMITNYKANLQSTSDIVSLQDGHGSTHRESKNEEIPDVSRHILD